MSKKNVLLVLLVVCVMTIMMIGVLGNETFTSTIINVTDVTVYDSKGNKLERLLFDKNGNIANRDEEGNLIDANQYKEYDPDFKADKEAYRLSIPYSQDALVEKDGKRYLELDFYLLVNPSNATYPEINASLSQKDQENEALALINSSFNFKDGQKEDASFIKVTVARNNDSYKEYIPFDVSLPEGKDSQEYLFVKYTLAVLFTEVGEYDPDNFDPEDPNSYVGAIKIACQERSSSCSINISESTKNTIVVDIPELILAWDYQMTAEEISQSSEELG